MGTGAEWAAIAAVVGAGAAVYSATQGGPSKVNAIKSSEKVNDSADNQRKNTYDRLSRLKKATLLSNNMSSPNIKKTILGAG